MTAFTVRGPDGRPRLAGVRFDLAPGRVVALVGEPGAGKSTLLAALAGLVPVEGIRPATPGPVGLALGPPPAPDGVPPLEYLRTLAAARGLEPDRAAEALSEVGLSPAEAIDRRVAYRVEIARALLGSPGALLLDDALDLPEAEFEHVRALARRRADSGSSVVLAGTRLDRAASIEGASIARLVRGRLEVPPAPPSPAPEPPARAPETPSLFRPWLGLELRLASVRPGLHVWALVLVLAGVAAIVLRYRGAYGSASPGADVHAVLAPFVALCAALAGVHLGASPFARDRRDLPIALVRLVAPARAAVWRARLATGLVRSLSLVALAVPLLAIASGLDGPSPGEVARSALHAAAAALAGLSIGAFAHAMLGASTTAALLAHLAILAAANVLVRAGGSPGDVPRLVPAALVLLAVAAAVDRRRV